MTVPPPRPSLKLITDNTTDRSGQSSGSASGSGPNGRSALKLSWREQLQWWIPHQTMVVRVPLEPEQVVASVEELSQTLHPDGEGHWKTVGDVDGEEEVGRFRLGPTGFWNIWTDATITGEGERASNHHSRVHLTIQHHPGTRVILAIGWLGVAVALIGLLANSLIVPMAADTLIWERLLPAGVAFFAYRQSMVRFHHTKHQRLKILADVWGIEMPIALGQ